MTQNIKNIAATLLVTALIIFGEFCIVAGFWGIGTRMNMDFYVWSVALVAIVMTYALLAARGFERAIEARRAAQV